MNPGDREHMQHLAEAMEDSQIMWQTVCSRVDDDRVEMLINVMSEQYALVMEGENNANAIMALIGFIANQVLNIADDGDTSIEAAMVLLQMGMQKGVQAHLAVITKQGLS